MSAEMTQTQLATAAEHLMAAKMFSLASCVMLFYDIAITFGDEVERIWKQRFTGATVLWFLNRYLSPLGYIVIIVSFHDPSWSKAACQRYVLYPEVLKVFTATTVGIIFILRLYAIYSKSKAVLYGFTALLVIELAIKIWAFTDGVMLQLPPGFVGCILTGKSSPGDRIIYTWVAELVFDSLVFFATLYRTIQLYRRTLISQALSLIAVIMRDGIMYFAVIFVSNLVTVLIFVFAPPDLKVINASFSTLITSLMVSRLMLNLRGEVLRRGPVISSHHSTSHNIRDVPESYQLEYTKHETETGWSAFSSIVGNLGAPVITFEAENSSYYDDLNENEDDAMDPTFLQTTPRKSKFPRKPPPHLQHVYPPLPRSPRSADPLRKTFADRSLHSRQPTDSSDETMGWTRVAMPDTPPPSGPSSPTLRSVNRQPSAESSSSASASAFTFATLPRKTKLARLKTLSRPRTADSTTSERDVVEMMQTRSMPAPLVVQVTEEVLVDHVGIPDEDDGDQGPRSTEDGSGSGSRGRRPWLAPPSWRLSRDGHYEEG